MKILITGSDPFGGETVNPAYEAVKLLPDTIAGAEIIKLEVPTRFHRAGAVLEDAMQRHKPDAVICVGQAGGRAAITPEKVPSTLWTAASRTMPGISLWMCPSGRTVRPLTSPPCP